MAALKSAIAAIALPVAASFDWWLLVNRTTIKATKPPITAATNAPMVPLQKAIQVSQEIDAKVPQTNKSIPGSYTRAATRPYRERTYPMAWFNADDKMHSHPKSRAVGLEAIGLWTLAGTYSAANGPHGHISEAFVS